jgi:hypothetical protein
MPTAAILSKWITREFRISNRPQGQPQKCKRKERVKGLKHPLTLFYAPAAGAEMEL